MKHYLRQLVLICGLLAGAALAEKPNVLLILTDDLGYSDLGCYGSEIATPNLDRLAADGLRFTQFYNTAKCHSTRVSLLSGRWCRQAGDESLKRAVILPEVLQPAGYFTAMSGKWHLSKEPTDFGFQRYFGHLSGATDYYKGDKSFRLNGQPWQVPEKGFYTTVANVDHALGFMEEARGEKKPWFLYLAFNAPHAPLQPLEADYQKYLGKYDAGWDAVREKRLLKQKELGLFGRELQASPRPDHIAAWDSLTLDEQSWEARRMTAYAALIDRVDQEIGRLVRDLEANGELDNTLILFLSDNGACPYDRRSLGRDREPYESGVKWSDSTGWAWARNSPFRYYKQNQFEGGISTPAIAHWPAGLKTAPGALVHSPAHLVDVLPTLADIAGAQVPQTWPGRDPSPLAGVSLKPIFEGEKLASRPPIHLLFASDRGLRDGDWKLVSFQSQPWELYNIAEDRTELNDLAGKHPEIVEKMSRQWHEMTENVLKAPASELKPVAAEATEQRHREWTVYVDAKASRMTPETGKGKARKGKGKGKAKAAAAGTKMPRARVGTKLTVEGAELVLECTGEDPGLAFNGVPGVTVAGPYSVVFSVQSQASGGGEVYYTTDAKTILPKGKHLTFDVQHDGQWHSHTVKLETSDTLHSFRLDACAGPGSVRIKELKLLDAQGHVLQNWP